MSYTLESFKPSVNIDIAFGEHEEVDNLFTQVIDIYNENSIFTIDTKKLTRLFDKAINHDDGDPMSKDQWKLLSIMKVAVMEVLTNEGMRSVKDSSNIFELIRTLPFTLKSGGFDNELMARFESVVKDLRVYPEVELDTSGVFTWVDGLENIQASCNIMSNDFRVSVREFNSKYDTHIDGDAIVDMVALDIGGSTIMDTFKAHVIIKHISLFLNKIMKDKVDKFLLKDVNIFACLHNVSNDFDKYDMNGTNYKCSLPHVAYTIV